MRNERSDSYHLRPERLDVLYVLDYIVNGLVRASCHYPCPCLVPDGFESGYASEPVFQGHSGWMQHSIMSRIMCLVPEQVSCGSGVEESPVAFLSPLSERQGDGAVREPAVNQPAYFLYEIILFIGEFSSLEYKCPESQSIPAAAPVYDFVVCQHIAADVPVALPDPAVETVIPAYIREFHEASDIYATAESLH